MRIPFSVRPRHARRVDVTGVGENSVDLVGVVAEFPVPDSKQPLLDFQQHCGGQIATALVACRRLGLRARYIGRFGSDAFGAASRASLAGEGVDLSFALDVRGAKNRFAMIVVDGANGARTVLWQRDPLLAIGAGDVPEEAIASARMVLVDALDPAASAEAARYARVHGIPTVVDIDRVEQGVDELLRLTDAIIVAREVPEALTRISDLGRALRSIAREFNAPLVCATLGAEGSLALCGDEEIRTPGFAIDCVDSTGAGDVFRAGFMAGCLGAGDGTLETALAFANAAAALNCQSPGARGGLPDRHDVELLLTRRGA